MLDSCCQLAHCLLSGWLTFSLRLRWPGAPASALPFCVGGCLQSGLRGLIVSMRSRSWFAAARTSAAVVPVVLFQVAEA